jgi:hypothetical protein
LAEALGKPGQRLRKALGHNVGVRHLKLARDGCESNAGGDFVDPRERNLIRSGSHHEFLTRRYSGGRLTLTVLSTARRACGSAWLCPHPQVVTGTTDGAGGERL